MLITHLIRTDLSLHLKCYSGDRYFSYWLLNSAGQEIQDAMWCTSMSSELLSGPSSAAEGSFLGRVQQYWTVHMEIKVQVGMSLCPIESLVGPSTACNITPHLHVHHARPVELSLVLPLGHRDSSQSEHFRREVWFLRVGLGQDTTFRHCSREIWAACSDMVLRGLWPHPALSAHLVVLNSDGKLGINSTKTFLKCAPSLCPVFRPNPFKHSAIQN